MKALVLIFGLSIAALGCSGSTEYGECIGVVEDGEPNLKYKVSIRNAFWSIIGFETIIAPILWATDYAKCPVGNK